MGISCVCVSLHTYTVYVNMHLYMGVGEAFNKNPVIYCNAFHTRNCHLLNICYENSRIVNVRNLKLALLYLQIS